MNDIKNNGFMILENVFSNQEIDICRSEINNYIKNNKCLKNSGGLSIPDFINMPGLENCRQLMKNPKIYKCFDSILGPNNYRFCSHNDIGINRVGVIWHKDKLNGNSEKYQTTNIWGKKSGEEHKIFKVLIYLQESFNDKSGLKVVPKSHLDKKIKTDNSIELQPKLGDVIIIDQRITHKGMDFQVDYPRILLSFGFGKNNIFTNEFEKGTIARQMYQKYRIFNNNNKLVISDINRKNEEKGTGKYFVFNKKSFIDIFGSFSDGSIIKVNQIRSNKVIWSGEIRYWDNISGGVHGRRNTDADNKQWEKGDIIAKFNLQLLPSYKIYEPVCTIKKIPKINIDGRICHHRVSILYYLTELYNLTNYIEIGVHNGTSMSYVLSSKNNKICIGIDPFETLLTQDKYMTHYLKKDNITEKKTYSNLQKNNKFNSKIKLIKKLSSDVLDNEINDITYDLLFIDGDHSYQSVISDYNKYINHVKRFGFIVFDDLHQDGPKKAFLEILHYDNRVEFFGIHQLTEGIFIKI